MSGFCIYKIVQELVGPAVAEAGYLGGGGGGDIECVMLGKL
jgi:hypothetical protein